MFKKRSSQSSRWALTLILMGLVWSCSARGPSHGPADVPVAEGSAPSESRDRGQRATEIIRAAQRELARGERLLEQQNPGEARLAFDRAVDLLLSVEGGVDEHPEIKAVYTQLISHIHALELRGLGTISDEPPGETLWQEELESAIAVSEMDDVPSPSLRADTDTYDLPIDYNKKVAAIVEMFQTRRREWFQAALQRSGQYIDFARKAFQEEGLPQDLVYLGMVESAFKTRAVSRAGARGIWQFMGGTGRLYGLRQDYWVDHRFDPEKSTRAAASHLKDLYEEFGDWYLVMAAYNAGTNRVKRAIARTGSRNFWTLSATRYLRRETKSYVPLILATIVIAKNPERFGFERHLNPPLEYDVVQIEAPMDLGTAAECAGTSISEMKKLNPELRRWVTPLNRPEYALRIPVGTRDAFCQAVASIPPDKRVRFVAYTVRRGDTLSHIARRYRTSINSLVDANRISRSSIIRPGQVLTVPVPDGTVPRAESNQRRGPVSLDVVDQDLYVVQPGDTLSEIAEAHGVGLTSLRRWNRLGRRSLIHPGQKLVICENNEISSERRVTYRVRRGDTLIEIARRFSVSVEQIRRWNNLTGDKIVTGESLEIYTSGS